MEKGPYQLYSYEYVCLDVNGQLRSKRKIELTEYASFEDLPVWNIDGSSIGLTTTDKSEILLKPVRIRNDPFVVQQPLYSGAYLVLCETLFPDGTPTPNNSRGEAVKRFEQAAVAEQYPWFGLEIEFLLQSRDFKKPVYGKDLPLKQGQYYCGVGAENVYQLRQCVDEMIVNAAAARISVCGCNAEVAPAQWEIQIGIISGIKAADDFYLMKYIMQRTAEKYNLSIDFRAKPLGPDWNGSGCHTNFSVERMRKEGAQDKGVFSAILSELQNRYPEILSHCGRDNELRMTGHHETAQLSTFTWGVGNRAASLRIPTQVSHDGCGYFEFRVPNCEMDAYQVLSRLAEIAATAE